MEKGLELINNRKAAREEIYKNALTDWKAEHTVSYLREIRYINGKNIFVFEYNEEDVCVEFMPRTNDNPLVVRINGRYDMYSRHLDTSRDYKVANMAKDIKKTHRHFVDYLSRVGNLIHTIY